MAIRFLCSGFDDRFPMLQHEFANDIKLGMPFSVCDLDPDFWPVIVMAYCCSDAMYFVRLRIRNCITPSLVVPIEAKIGPQTGISFEP